VNFWQTPLIRLRAVEPGDAVHYLLWAEDSLRARALEHVWPPASLPKVEEWVADRSRQAFDNADYSFVIENSARQVVGAISTQQCDPRAGTLSYALDIAADHRRKGYAIAAIRLVLRYYFNECRYQKATVSVHSGNEPSIALHRKLGFVREGCHRRMIFTDGAFQDALWFGQTVEEFNLQDPLQA
jgi:RimJ/RimL family protein N-acetyltransferase